MNGAKKLVVSQWYLYIYFPRKNFLYRNTLLKVSYNNFLERQPHPDGTLEGSFFKTLNTFIQYKEKLPKYAITWIFIKFNMVF